VEGSSLLGSEAMSLGDNSERFEGSKCLHIQNVRNYSTNNTESCPRRQEYSAKNIHVIMIITHTFVHIYLQYVDKALTCYRILLVVKH
jgi:hypothetical protein